MTKTGLGLTVRQMGQDMHAFSKYEPLSNTNNN